MPCSRSTFEGEQTRNIAEVKLSYREPVAKKRLGARSVAEAAAGKHEMGLGLRACSAAGKHNLHLVDAWTLQTILWLNIMH